MRYYDGLLEALGLEVVTEDEFTGAAILSRLLGVDGGESGLDADLLDGNHAAAFALSNDARLSDARTPTSHDHSGNKLAQANTHESVDTDGATTALHHTLGTGANQSCAGNDARLSDARIPTSHDHSGNKLTQANTHESVDTDSATTALHHTLGTGANQACGGSDARLSDARAPLSHSHSGDKLVQANTHESADTNSAATALHHTLGPGANQAARGTHTHFPGIGELIPKNTSYITSWYPGLATAFDPGAGNIYVHPITLTEQLVIETIGVRVATLNAPYGNVRIGIYTNVDDGFYPKQLVVSSNEIAISSTGQKIYNTTQTLSPGIYWLAFIHSGACGYNQVANNVFFNNSTTNYKGLALAYAYGELPSTFPSGSSLATQVPGIQVRCM